MQFSAICPVSALDSIARERRYHLILAHLCEPNSRYREFYKELAARGDTIILDTSTHELGSAPDAEKLLEIAQDIVPSIVVLPDVLEDPVATLKRTMAAVDLLHDERWRLMAVPQVATGLKPAEVLESWFESLEQMYTESRITAIGMCLDGSQFFRTQGGRGILLREMEKRELVRPGYFYHILGLGSKFTEILDVRDFSWVRGMDSAKPVTAGLHGLLIHPQKGLLTPRVRRPQNFFSAILDDFQLDTVRKNLKTIDTWLGE